MHTIEVVKTVATTINAIFDIGLFAASIYLAKEKNNKPAVILLLVISAWFIANSAVMWL